MADIIVPDGSHTVDAPAPATAQARAREVDRRSLPRTAWASRRSYMERYNEKRLPSGKRRIRRLPLFKTLLQIFGLCLSADPRTYDSSTRGWRCQTPEHDADHGETDEGDNGSGITLEVAGEAPVAADPGERSLHDPAFRQDHESVRVGALNDFQLPAAGRGDGRRHPRPLVAAVGEDGLDEGERTARGSKQLAGAVAILHVGGMDDDAQQQAECIDEDVALAPRDLLARIEALRVERSPPFCAPLALWLSITAADGLASRPSRSRTAT